jgi:hypothetical protein
LAEDAAASFDNGNPVGIPVAAAGGNSSPFTLIVYARELLPDQSEGTSHPGEISNAVVGMSLVPVGPGVAVNGTCTDLNVAGTGYDARLGVACSFNTVAVNTYTVVATISGDYYIGGGEDVVTVYDPSLGFTTGGGWFYWPDTSEKVNFGYTMKYNKKRNKIQGSLLLIRHLADGSIYRIKSNALYGLALGEADSFGWASFSGKATYLEPGMLEPEGNQGFIAYVEDHGESGSGVDKFWIELQGKDGTLIPAMSMDRQARDNTVVLGGGNIVVPH